MYMPSPISIAGISMLIHIGINIIAVCYRRIREFFAPSPQATGTGVFFADSIDRKQRKRRTSIFSYGIVSAILAIVAVQSYFLLTVGLKSHATYTVVQNIFDRSIKTDLPEPAALPSVSAPDTQNVPASMPEVKFSAAIFGDHTTPQKTLTSVVDLMRKNDFNDISFKARAYLAKELGVVKDVSEYGGSSKQNRQLFNALESKLRTGDEDNSKNNSIVSSR